MKLLHFFRGIKRRSDFVDFLLSDIKLLAKLILAVLVPNIAEEQMHFLCEVWPEGSELG
jgi:hypothetical protein